MQVQTMHKMADALEQPAMSTKAACGNLVNLAPLHPAGAMGSCASFCGVECINSYIVLVPTAFKADINDNAI